MVTITQRTLLASGDRTDPNHRRYSTARNCAFDSRQAEDQSVGRKLCVLALGGIPVRCVSDKHVARYRSEMKDQWPQFANEGQNKDRKKAKAFRQHQRSACSTSEASSGRCIKITTRFAQ
jgi:hypothetical protein